jgi:hypothetical protein
MSVALRGNIKDFGIAEVFQLIGQQRKTGMLEFSGSEEQVQLVVDRGAIVSAAARGARPHEALGEMLVRCGLLTPGRVEELHRECSASAHPLGRLAVGRGWLREQELEAIEDLLTRETIFRILRWESGSFDFRSQEVEHGRPFETLLGAEQILMDGLRMVDEWQSFAELVPSEDLIFQKSGRFDDFRAAARVESPAQLEAARRVYDLVDGRLAVRRIIDLSLLGTFDATRILAELRRASAIEPLDAEGTQRLVRRRRPPVALRRPKLRDAVAAIVPLVLLLLAAIFANLGAPAPAAERDFPIERGALKAAREAHDARRVRHAVDTFRFLQGRWPRELAELEDRQLLGTRPLARAPAPPYYYAHREGEALLLAPER